MWRPWRVLRDLVAWPADSQQVARHNALVAATALTEHRRQQVEVEEFLAELSHDRRQPAPRRSAS